MALVDADYCFIWVKEGANGSSSDVQIFNTFSLKEAILDGSIDFPAFAFKTLMMKTYSVKGLSREHRIHCI
jgi:hypothetical protein